jgi:hypothetical protein
MTSLKLHVGPSGVKKEEATCSGVIKDSLLFLPLWLRLRFGKSRPHPTPVFPGDLSRQERGLQWISGDPNPTGYGLGRSPLLSRVSISTSVEWAK